MATRLSPLTLPLADSFGMSRLSKPRTLLLCAVVWLAAMGVLIAAAYHYDGQTMTEQVALREPLMLSDGTVDPNCFPIGTPQPFRLYNNTPLGPDEFAGTLLEIQYRRKVPPKYTSAGQCFSWLSQVLRYRFDEARPTYPNRLPVTFKLKTGHCIYPPDVDTAALNEQEAAGTLDFSTAPPCVTVTCGLEDFRPDELFPNSVGDVITLMKLNCSLQAKDLNPPVFVVDTLPSQYRLNFICNVDFTARSLPVNYTGKCSPSGMQATLTSELRRYCDQFPVINGPYVCQRTIKREMFDILNLSFAAGTTVALLASLLLRYLHDRINPPADHAKLPDLSSRIELRQANGAC